MSLSGLLSEACLNLIYYLAASGVRGSHSNGKKSFDSRMEILADLRRGPGVPRSSSFVNKSPDVRSLGSRVKTGPRSLDPGVERAVQDEAIGKSTKERKKWSFCRMAISRGKK